MLYIQGMHLHADEHACGMCTHVYLSCEYCVQHLVCVVLMCSQCLCVIQICIACCLEGGVTLFKQIRSWGAGGTDRADAN